MRFSELLESAGVKAVRRGGDADVCDVQFNSRRCVKGSCFVAVKGSIDDGHKYIQAAVEAGASAVVCSDESFVPGGVPLAVLDDPRTAMGMLAQAINGWPARKLFHIGVTGTNGKSTTTILIRDVLESAGHKPALLGTITYETGKTVKPADTTTPDPVALAQMEAEMVAAGKTHLVMEVSSHALHQNRVGGLKFNVGVFTNLTGDHLDYHKTMEDYLAAKRLLFENLPADAVAVINRDDPAGEELAKATKARVVWYGLSSAADLQGRIERIGTAGTAFKVISSAGDAAVDTPLIGRHNVYNCLGAVGACMGAGVALADIAAVLSKVHNVPGRLQRVPSDAPFTVFVDYAHTDDALVNVLNAVRPITKGRIILVFGCGGDRDRTKRPRMAKVAGELADRIVITSDNPRSEDPREIIREILAGLDEQGRGKSLVEPDRRLAIKAAIEQAKDGDVVIIAGKGHEKYQIIGSQRNHFDDVEVAGEFIAGRAGR